GDVELKQVFAGPGYRPGPELVVESQPLGDIRQHVQRKRKVVEHQIDKGKSEEGPIHRVPGHRLRIDGGRLGFHPRLRWIVAGNVQSMPVSTSLPIVRPDSILAWARRRFSAFRGPRFSRNVERSVPFS